MFTIDLFIILFSSVQPLIIGFIVTISFNNIFFSSRIYKNYNNLRNKTNSTKLYECSTYSRLNNKFIYSIQVISTCLAYVIYDVDVIFFFSESTNIFDYSADEIWVIAILVFFFIFGILFDFKKLTFNWKF